MSERRRDWRGKNEREEKGRDEQKSKQDKTFIINMMSKSQSHRLRTPSHGSVQREGCEKIRKRETNDRQTDRETDPETDRDRQTKRQTHRETNRRTDKQAWRGGRETHEGSVAMGRALYISTFSLQ